MAIVENPENNESIANYINTTIEDNYFWLDNKAYKNLSSEEKSMVYDLKKFNVYKLDITFVNKTSLYATCFTANYCRKDTYMMVPTIFGYTNVAEGYKETYSYYVFVSKNFSLTDIQDYLEKNGIDFYVIFERKLSGGSFRIKSYFDADNG